MHLYPRLRWVAEVIDHHVPVQYHPGAEVLPVDRAGLAEIAIEIDQARKLGGAKRLCSAKTN